MTLNTALDVLADALRCNGKQVIDHSGRLSAQCPAHDDQQPSLSIGPRKDGNGVLVHCHAGCDYRDVLAAVGLSVADLFDDDKMRNAYSDQNIYTYPGGRQVHRERGKRFWQAGNKGDTSLFGADHITADTNPVYVCEGEKDVLAAQSVGAVAVCPAMGAGKANRFDWSPLRGKHVKVVADCDEPGRKHAREVAELLRAMAASVRIMQAASGKDLADHIAAGKALDELMSTDNGRPRLWRATDLRPAEQPRWLAKGRLPRGAISLIVGDEGIGKSLLWVWIVAAVTTGKPLPEFGIPGGDPAHVVLVCTEDDWTTTVRPRLEVAGADLVMAQVICTEDDGSGAPIFPRDLFLIAEADPAPALVVVDAWLDTVPPMLSVRDPQQARQALHPWKEVATVTDAAVLLLCHTNRVASANARDRYGATGELRKKARMTLYAQADDDGRLVVGPEKMNTAAPIPASTFTISSVQQFTPTPDSDGTVPLLVYAGDSERTAREHITDSYEAEHGSDPQDHADAQRWLREYLSEEGPRAKSAYAKREAEKAGITEKVLRRARVKLGVVIGYEGMPATSVWSLPEQVNADDRPSGDQHTVSEDVTGTTGENASVSAGQDRYVQLRPFEGDGHNRAHQPLPAKIDQNPPVVPGVPEIHEPAAQQPPGGLTARTPGQTPRVQQALASARNYPDRPPLCPVCERAPARADSGVCDFCTVKAGRQQTGGEAPR